MLFQLIMFDYLLLIEVYFVFGFYKIQNYVNYLNVKIDRYQNYFCKVKKIYYSMIGFYDKIIFNVKWIFMVGQFRDVIYGVIYCIQL